MILSIKGHPLKQVVCWALYYGFARHLPISYDHGKPGRWARKIRRRICRNIFEYCGENVNVEHGANFGTGFHIHIGDNSSIGVHANIPCDLHIGRNVMIGPNFKIFTQNHRFDRVDIPKIQQGFSYPPPPTG